MDDCDLIHGALMNALIQPRGQSSTDTHITCLLISNESDKCNFEPHEPIAKSLKVIYDTSLRRSRDGHLIESPPIDASSPTCDQSNIVQEFSLLTATTSHAKESGINCCSSDEELVDSMQIRPFTMFDSIFNYLLDGNTPSTQYTQDSAFDVYLKYFGQALKETNLTLLDLEGYGMDRGFFFDFVKHLQGTKVGSLILPTLTCSMNGNVKGNNLDTVGESKKDSTLIDSSCCNEEIRTNCLEYSPTILKDTQIISLDFACNRINLIKLSSSLIDSKITCLGLRGCNIQNDGLSCLARILKDTQITSIDLSDNQLNCQSLKIFAPGLEGTKITSLNFSQNEIGVDGLNCLGKVLKNTQISSIDISYNILNNGCLELFVSYLVDSKITSLSFQHTDLGVDNVNCLGSVLKNTGITSIDFSKNNLKCKSLNALLAGLVGSKMNSLNLSGNYFDNDDIQCLGNVLKETKITSIDLGVSHLMNFERLKVFASSLLGTKLTCIFLTGNESFSRNRNVKCSKYQTYEVLAHCLVDTNVTSLGLRSNYPSIDELKCLGNSLKDSKITSIDLSYNCFFDSSMEIFAPFLVDSNITSLDLSGNNFNHKVIEYLAPALKNTQIVSLNLANCSLSCESLKNLLMYLPETKITLLNLSGNNICCNIFYLAFVLKHTQITSLEISYRWSSLYCLLKIMLYENNNSLDLSQRRLCTLIICYIGRFLKNTKIISLNLSSNNIDHNGLKYLSHGLLNSRIVELNLSSCNIDCSGAYYLSLVLRHSRISSLNLASNRIACEGLKYLAQGLAGSPIASLDLRENIIKDEGVRYLAEILADTQIVEIDLTNNMIESEAVYQLCKSVCQKKVNFIQLKISKRDRVGTTYFSLYRYPGCIIEINQIVPRKEADSGRLIKDYQKSGIIKLIFTEDYSVNLDGSFDNMNITEIEFDMPLLHNIISMFEKSNIANLKIDVCYDMLKLLKYQRINVIALHLKDFPTTDPAFRNLKSVLMVGNIGYLDLTNQGIESIGKSMYVFETLVAVLKDSKIISLNLSCNCIEAESVELLARVLPDTKLTYIDLHGNRIGYLGFKYLMNIVDKTSICWLSLGNNNIEEGLQNDVELSPYIVPRNDTPIEFQIRYLFRELVALDTASEQFEFIVPREDSVMSIVHYPRLVKHLLDTPIYKMHIYDYFYMQSMRRHDIHMLNRINLFIIELKPNFMSFFESRMVQIGERFGYDSFVSLVEECDGLNLTDFVEFLLLHRLLYYVDDEQNFLHPFIYKMLHKYQMPLYNEDLEPNKKHQIISYFEEHSDIDGVREIIDLLKKLN